MTARTTLDRTTLGERAVGFMTPALSIYLDAVRFLAALAVVIGHGLQYGLYRGPYLMSHYGHESVVCFFVLSGLVISITAFRRETTLRRYAVARLSRVYSVVLAAIPFCFTAFVLARALGFDLPPTVWQGQFGVWPAISSLLFLNQSWFNPAGLILNRPYWSLCYEVFYYLAFGVAMFAPRWRWPLVAGVLGVAGPAIVALLPIWLMGAALALSRWPRRIGPIAGLLLFVGGVALAWWLVASGIDWRIQAIMRRVPGWWVLGASQRAVTDVALGGLVVVNFAGARALSGQIGPALARAERPIRFLANSSFTLYIFHFPLLMLARGGGLSAGDDPVRFTALLAVVVAICVGIAALTEARRGQLARLIDGLLDRRPRAPSLATDDPARE